MKLPSESWCAIHLAAELALNRQTKAIVVQLLSVSGS